MSKKQATYTEEKSERISKSNLSLIFLQGDLIEGEQKISREEFEKLKSRLKHTISLADNCIRLLGEKVIK